MVVVDLTIVIAGAGGAVTVQVSSSVTAAPEGGVPVAVAVLATWPWSTSAWVSVYGSAVQVMDSAGASSTSGQATVSAGPAGAWNASVTATSWSVTLPVLVTSKV